MWLQTCDAETCGTTYEIIVSHIHCMKSVLIRSFYSQYFPTFGLNTERYGETEGYRDTDLKTPNTDTFHAVTDSNT